jgi:hypothetical protein
VERRGRLLHPSQAKWLHDRMIGIANGTISELGTMPAPPAPQDPAAAAAVQVNAAHEATIRKLQERETHNATINCRVARKVIGEVNGAPVFEPEAVGVGV